MRQPINKKFKNSNEKRKKFIAKEKEATTPASHLFRCIELGTCRARRCKNLPAPRRW